MNKCEQHCACNTNKGNKCCYCHEEGSEEQRLEQFLNNSIKKGNYGKAYQQEEAEDDM
jgi:hypothetical protein